MEGTSAKRSSEKTTEYTRPPKKGEPTHEHQHGPDGATHTNERGAKSNTKCARKRSTTKAPRKSSKPHTDVGAYRIPIHLRNTYT